MDGMEQTVRSLPSRQEKMLVFFSYARQDKTLRDKLEEHLSNLKYRGLITTWHEREITAGEEPKQQIDAYLDRAQIILLLISASFMASDYCYGVEMARALTRHQQGAARVIPILLRPVLYTSAPFASLKILPTNGKPVVTWRNRDSAFVDIALYIEQVVEERKRVAAVTPTSPAQAPYQQPQADWGTPNTPASTPAYQPPPPPMPAYGGQTLAPPPPMSAYGGQTLAPPPPPAGQARLTRSKRSARVVLASLLGVLVLIGLIGGLIAYLQSSAPALYPILLTAAGLFALAGIFIAIRAIYVAARNRREQEALRRRQEALAREQEETRRRAREEAERRKREEALKRAREEARRQEQERAYQERIYYNNALIAYEQALQLNPRDITALRGKANALDGLGRYNEALEAFQQALALNNNASTYSHIGDTLTKLRRYEDALTAYKQAIAIDPDLAEAYFHMGDVFDKLGQRQKAAQACEKARQLGYED